MRRPRYPVYVPSKGRAATPLTIRALQRDDLPFRVVVEPQEAERYLEAVQDETRILTLPESGQGLIYARNWIKQHATAEGHARHWQLDDNIMSIYRAFRDYRIPCAAGPALAAVEDFVDRYENVAVAGLNYDMFFVPRVATPPFRRNVHVYSCSLIDNAIPYRWRLRYNDDTDFCLQVLAGGLCTVLVNVFLAKKVRTMKLRGGNTDDLYQGDGRLVMARSLERVWPGVVRTARRFGRPQHVVDWRHFKTPLRLRPDVDLDALPAVDEYGLTLRQVREVRDPALRALISA